MQETLRIYTKATYAKNNLRGDPRFEEKMMWRMTQEMRSVNWRLVVQVTVGWRRATGEVIILLG
jgi:hypothetical protein